MPDPHDTTTTAVAAVGSDGVLPAGEYHLTALVDVDEHGRLLGPQDPGLLEQWAEHGADVRPVGGKPRSDTLAALEATLSPRDQGVVEQLETAGREAWLDLTAKLARIEELEDEVARLRRANAALAERPTANSYLAACAALDVRQRGLAQALGDHAGTGFYDLVGRVAVLREAVEVDKGRWLEHYDALVARAAAGGSVDSLELRAAYAAGMTLAHVTDLLAGRGTEADALGGVRWLLDAFAEGRAVADEAVAEGRSRREEKAR